MKTRGRFHSPAVLAELGALRVSDDTLVLFFDGDAELFDSIQASFSSVGAIPIQSLRRIKTALEESSIADTGLVPAFGGNQCPPESLFKRFIANAIITFRGFDASLPDEPGRERTAAADLALFHVEVFLRALEFADFRISPQVVLGPAVGVIRRVVEFAPERALSALGALRLLVEGLPESASGLADHIALLAPAFGTKAGPHTVQLVFAAMLAALNEPEAAVSTLQIAEALAGPQNPTAESRATQREVARLMRRHSKDIQKIYGDTWEVACVQRAVVRAPQRAAGRAAFVQVCGPLVVSRGVDAFLPFLRVLSRSPRPRDRCTAVLMFSFLVSERGSCAQLLGEAIGIFVERMLDTDAKVSEIAFESIALNLAACAPAPDTLQTVTDAAGVCLGSRSALQRRGAVLALAAALSCTQKTANGSGKFVDEDSKTQLRDLHGFCLAHIAARVYDPAVSVAKVAVECLGEAVDGGFKGAPQAWLGAVPARAVEGLKAAAKDVSARLFTPVVGTPPELIPLLSGITPAGAGATASGSPECFLTLPALDAAALAVCSEGYVEDVPRAISSLAQRAEAAAEQQGTPAGCALGGLVSCVAALTAALDTTRAEEKADGRVQRKRKPRSRAAAVATAIPQVHAIWAHAWDAAGSGDSELAYLSLETLARLVTFASRGTRAARTEFAEAASFIRQLLALLSAYRLPTRMVRPALAVLIASTRGADANLTTERFVTFVLELVEESARRLLRRVKGRYKDSQDARVAHTFGECAVALADLADAGDAALPPALFTHKTFQLLRSIVGQKLTPLSPQRKEALATGTPLLVAASGDFTPSRQVHRTPGSTATHGFAVQAHATAALGKVGLVEEALFDQCADSLVEIARAHESAAVRSNAVLALASFIRVDPPRLVEASRAIMLGLNDRAPLVQRQALIALTGLASRGFVKVRPELWCSFLPHAASPNAELRALTRRCLVMLGAEAKYAQSYFTAAMASMNNCALDALGGSLGAAADRAPLALERRARVVPDSAARLSIYEFLVSLMPISDAFRLGVQVIEQLLAPRARGERAHPDALVGDALCLISEGVIRIAPPEEPRGSQRVAEIATIVARDAVSRLYHQHVAENVIPTLLRLRALFRDEVSPLQGATLAALGRVYDDLGPARAAVVKGHAYCAELALALAELGAGAPE